MAARRPSTIPVDPPDRLDESAAEVWREVVARGAISPKADAAMLEVYCVLVAQSRTVAQKLSSEGLVVADDKKGAVVHPALAAARQLADDLRVWAPMFNAPKAAVRNPRGPMYSATKQSIAAEPKLVNDDRFKGACEAVLTLAWLIDEAQREGLDALRQASYVMIPSYLKGCAALQITPASLPAGAGRKRPDGKLRKFEDSATRRQALAG
jgi:P27 family predicted phage terminase small subunit